MNTKKLCAALLLASSFLTVSAQKWYTPDIDQR